VRTRKAHEGTLARLPLHFLTGEELSRSQLSGLLDRALALKAKPTASRALEGRTVALLFEHPSTRTRTSMEAGIVELGGHPMVLRASELQLTRGESLRDTALVFSRHACAIGLRTGSEERLRGLAAHAQVPVVNMLSPDHHPCQALADLMTLGEALGSLEGRALAYVGDGNNVARSLAILGTAAGLDVRIAAPAAYQLPQAHGATLTDDPAEAVAGADAVYTDVWVSMGDDDARGEAGDEGRSPEAVAERRAALAPYRLDDALLDRAAPGAFALHCLPAHPGEEITEEVLYGDRQRIWDQAENRRHAQKALLELLVSAP
jgi:ornithine carbamoyltransferase